MKYFVFLVVLLQGEPEPFLESKEVATIQECWKEVGKLLQHPIPPNAKEFQAGCAIVNAGNPA